MRANLNDENENGNNLGSILLLTIEVYSNMCRKFKEAFAHKKPNQTLYNLVSKAKSERQKMFRIFLGDEPLLIRQIGLLGVPE